MSEGRPMIRALYRSVSLPDVKESIYSKIYYPAIYSGSELENNTGALPADNANAPYPVAIFMPGINVSPESYGWLATALTNAGFVSVIYGWINEEMPGLPALSPGLDVSALSPDDYGKRPSATALSALLGALDSWNSEGPLTGMLDLDRILLGGHSAGGSVALMNAQPDWFPALKAVFAYGSHSKASTMLGYPPETVLELPDALPLLIMGGSEDGVIAASAFRYGDDGSSEPDPIGPLQRTFDEGITRQQGDCHLALIEGANHFSLCWPEDHATGRPFLDWPISRDDAEIREDIAALVCRFAAANVTSDSQAAEALKTLLSDKSSIRLTNTK